MDLPATRALQELKNSLKRIKALIEWVRLKQMENRLLDPFFQIADSTEVDLKTELQYFLIRLNDLQKHAQENETVRVELTQLQHQFQQLNLPTGL